MPFYVSIAISGIIKRIVYAQVNTHYQLSIKDSFLNRNIHTKQKVNFGILILAD